jgi:hypothetical protein
MLSLPVNSICKLTFLNLSNHTNPSRRACIAGRHAWNQAEKRIAFKIIPLRKATRVVINIQLLEAYANLRL